MCLLDLFQGMEGGWGTVDIAWAFLGGFLLVRSNTKKWGDHRNKKIINKSVKALILFKKGHQGLLKLHILLRGCSTVEENEAPKREFCLKQKNNIWGGLSRPIEILCVFWMGFGVFSWKKSGSNRRKRFYNEMWGNRFWGGKGGLVKILWGGPIETVEWIWWIFGGCLIGFCHKTAEIHFRCIQLIN